MQATTGMVSFVDLVTLHGEMHDELLESFERVVGRGSFTLGEEVDAFEREFADHFGVAHAVGVGSGTDALHFALRACGIGPGDEVITVDNTFAATVEAILMAGARPVLVDIDEATYLMDLDAAEAAVTDRTAAIIPVHLYGQMVDMDRVLAIARRHGLKVVEDACQAHGARRNGHTAGVSGDAGCFSFYPGKNLGALGDGGMVVTNDAEIAAHVALLRAHGEDRDRLHVVSGYCSRLHGLQAAFLRAKLPRLDAWNARRGAAARAYADVLADIPAVLPSIAPGASHVFHLYVVRVADRDRVRAELAAAGVQTGIHYAVPLHLEPAFEGLGHARDAFPVTERVTREILSLPMHPCLSESDIEAVASALAASTDA